MSWPTWRELFRYAVEGMLAWLGLALLEGVWDGTLVWWRRRRRR